MKILVFVVILLALGYLMGLGYSLDDVPRIEIELSANPFVLLFLFFGILLLFSDKNKSNSNPYDH